MHQEGFTALCDLVGNALGRSEICTPNGRTKKTADGCGELKFMDDVLLHIIPS